MGHVRVGETEHVLERLKWFTHIWWLIVYEEDGGLEYTYVQSSCKKNLSALWGVLKRLQGKKHLVFAVWMGEHRTDLFLMEPLKVVKYLEELGYGDKR